MKFFQGTFISCMILLLNQGLGLADPLPGIEELLQKSRASYDRVTDYTCMMHRKDLVGGKLKEHTTVLFKFKKPQRYYMYWPEDKIEALYVQGKYNNKMVVHGGLLFDFISFAVEPEAALRYNRHTILEADIGHVIGIMEQSYKKAGNDPDARILFGGEEILDSRDTWRIKAIFPPDRGYYGHLININVDKELNLPIKVTVFGWYQELLEAYYYEDLKINTGLLENDFDANNDKYMFTLGY